MSTRILLALRIAATIAGVAGCLVVQSAHAQTIVDQWSSITAPPLPPLKAVTIDKNTTALLPGLGHGGGGAFSLSADVLSAIEQWSEGGTAPANLTGTDANPASAGRTRPLCAYPTWPKFVGGDVNAASAYSCVMQ